jgi:hypothetical protein
LSADSASPSSWAEPGEIAICFWTGDPHGSLTCIGSFWYQGAAGEAPWWTMTSGRPGMCYASSGSAARLREHVAAILVILQETLKDADPRFRRQAARFLGRLDPNARDAAPALAAAEALKSIPRK